MHWLTPLLRALVVPCFRRRLAPKVGCAYIQVCRTTVTETVGVPRTLTVCVTVCVCCLDFNEQFSHSSVIRQHYVFLLETLEVQFSGLVHELYSKEVVSDVERDDICAEQTSFRANEKLLSVLSRKSQQQFQLFLNALDNSGQQHVHNVITGRQQGWSMYS